MVKEAIKLCKKGELDHFQVLYDAYFQKIYNFVYYKTHHKETAEDLVSVTFLKALENIRGFDFNKGTFQAWLFRIARNTVCDYYRKKKSVTNIDDVWDLGVNDNFLSEIDDKKKLEDIFSKMANLTVQQREIITLRLWDNLSYKEIAEIMDKTIPACKMSFKRSIVGIQKEMLLLLLLIINI